MPVPLTGRTSCSRMPVIRAILNGHCFLCLVETGSQRTLVSLWVAESRKLRPGNAVLTADGKASHVNGRSDCTCDE